MARIRQIIIKNDPLTLAEKAVELFVADAIQAIRKKGCFNVALSGGSTPREMHKLLANQSYCSQISWKDVRIFWVDERCVPQDDPASNYGIAKCDFIDAVPIPESQVYPIRCGSAPRESAGDYQQILRDNVNPKNRSIPCFDLIFLGMGTDGHTASLFPQHSVLLEKEELVASVKGGRPNVDRISMTLPLLNQAHHIAFLVTGKEKAEIVKKVMEIRNGHLPAQRIQPSDGKLTWLLDRGSSALLRGGHNNECA